MIPQVNLEQVKGFANVWTHNGVAIMLSDIHLEFARDFANVMLRSFVEQQMAFAQKRAAEAAKPKIVEAS